MTRTLTSARSHAPSARSYGSRRTATPIGTSPRSVARRRRPFRSRSPPPTASSVSPDDATCARAWAEEASDPVQGRAPMAEPAADPIRLVEAAYRFDSSPSDWLSRLAAEAGRSFGGSGGAIIGVYDTPGRAYVKFGEVVSDGVG